MSSVPSIFTSPKKVQKSVRKASGFRTLFRQHRTNFVRYCTSCIPIFRICVFCCLQTQCMPQSDIFFSPDIFSRRKRIGSHSFCFFLLFFFCFSVFYLCLTCICSWNFPAASITLNAAIDSKIQFPACSNCRKNNPIMTRLSTHQIRRAR